MVKIGMIGMGQLGCKHATIFKSLPNVELIGVADIDQVRLQHAMDTFGVPGYQDAVQLCSLQELDAVSICTPDYDHKNSTLTALSNGKFVYLEKPLADNLNDAEEILNESGSPGSCRLMVGHLLRFDPRYVKAKQMIKAGTIGEIVHISAKRNSYLSGPLHYGNRYKLSYHLVVHEIDLISWLTGSTVCRVYAENRKKLLADRGMDDTIFTIIKMHDSSIVSLEHCWILHNGCSPETLGPVLEIVGTKGTIRISHVNGFELVGEDCDFIPDLSVYSTLEDGRKTGCLYSSLETYVDCISHNKDFPITAHDGYRTVAVVHALEESLVKHIPIYLSEP